MKNVIHRLVQKITTKTTEEPTRGQTSWAIIAIVHKSKNILQERKINF